MSAMNWAPISEVALNRIVPANKLFTAEELRKAVEAAVYAAVYLESVGQHLDEHYESHSAVECAAEVKRQRGEV